MTSSEEERQATAAKRPPRLHAVLQRVYPCVATLRGWVEELLAVQPTGARGTEVQREGDPAEYKELLQQTRVAWDPTTTRESGRLDPAVNGSVREVVAQLASELRHSDSVLCQAGLAGPQRGSWGASKLCLPSSAWETLHARIGSAMLRYLLAQHSVFLALDNDNLLQVSGPPFFQRKQAFRPQLAQGSITDRRHLRLLQLRLPGRRHNPAADREQLQPDGPAGCSSPSTSSRSAFLQRRSRRAAQRKDARGQRSTAAAGIGMACVPAAICCGAGGPQLAGRRGGGPGAGGQALGAEGAGTSRPGCSGHEGGDASAPGKRAPRPSSWQRRAAAALRAGSADGGARQATQQPCADSSQRRSRASAEGTAASHQPAAASPRLRQDAGPATAAGERCRAAVLGRSAPAPSAGGRERAAAREARCRAGTSGAAAAQGEALRSAAASGLRPKDEDIERGSMFYIRPFSAKPGLLSRHLLRLLPPQHTASGRVLYHVIFNRGSPLAPLLSAAGVLKPGCTQPQMMGDARKAAGLPIPRQHLHLLPLLQRVLRRMAQCPFGLLLEHHCPLPAGLRNGRHAAQPPADGRPGGADASGTGEDAGRHQGSASDSLQPADGAATLRGGSAAPAGTAAPLGTVSPLRWPAHAPSPGTTASSGGAQLDLRLLSHTESGPSSSPGAAAVAMEVDASALARAARAEAAAGAEQTPTSFSGGEGLVGGKRKRSQAWPADDAALASSAAVWRGRAGDASPLPAAGQRPSCAGPSRLAFALGAAAAGTESVPDGCSFPSSHSSGNQPLQPQQLPPSCCSPRPPQPACAARSQTEGSTPAVGGGSCNKNLQCGAACRNMHTGMQPGSDSAASAGAPPRLATPLPQPGARRSGAAPGAVPLDEDGPVPHRQVAAFAWAVLRRIVPSQLLGRRRARSKLRSKVLAMVRMRRYELMSVQQLMHGLPLTELAWLAPIHRPACWRRNRSSSADTPGAASTACARSAQRRPSHSPSAKSAMAALWLRWLFNALLVPLIRAHFYVTDSEPYRQEVFYFRKPVWAQMSQQKMQELKQQLLEELPHDVATRAMIQRGWGAARLRLLPKRSGMRPLMNMSHKTKLHRPPPAHAHPAARPGSGPSPAPGCWQLIPPNVRLRDTAAVLKYEALSRSASALPCSVFSYYDVRALLLRFLQQNGCAHKNAEEAAQRPSPSPPAQGSPQQLSAGTPACKGRLQSADARPTAACALASTKAADDTARAGADERGRPSRRECAEASLEGDAPVGLGSPERAAEEAPFLLTQIIPETPSPPQHCRSPPSSPDSLRAADEGPPSPQHGAQRAKLRLEMPDGHGGLGNPQPADEQAYRQQEGRCQAGPGARRMDAERSWPGMSGSGLAAASPPRLHAAQCTLQPLLPGSCWEGGHSGRVAAGADTEAGTSRARAAEGRAGAQQLHGGRRWYVACFDVTRAYDSIDPKRMRSLLEPLLSQREYRVIRFADGAPGPFCRFKRRTAAADAAYPGGFPEFCRLHLAHAQGGSLLVESSRSVCIPRYTLLQTLDQQLHSSFVRIGNKWYRQSYGVPQGSIISQLLCSIYLSHFDHCHLLPLLQPCSAATAALASARPTAGCGSAAGAAPLCSPSAVEGCSASQGHITSLAGHAASLHTSSSGGAAACGVPEAERSEQQRQLGSAHRGGGRLPELGAAAAAEEGSGAKQERHPSPARAAACHATAGLPQHAARQGFGPDSSCRQAQPAARRPTAAGAGIANRAPESESLLMRMVDDYLLITPHRSVAEAVTMRMHQGVEGHGRLAVNASKTKASFACRLGDGSELPARTLLSADGRRWIPWYGLLLDVHTLEVQADYTRYRTLHISSTMAMNLARNPGRKMVEKVRWYMKPKCHVLLLDAAINRPLTVHVNVYQSFLLAAMKLHAFARCLPWSPRCDDAVLHAAIHAAIRYVTSYVRTARKARRCCSRFEAAYPDADSSAPRDPAAAAVPGPTVLVSAPAIRCLALHAFRKILGRKQSLYPQVMAYLQNELHKPLMRRTSKTLADALEDNRSTVFDDIGY